MELRALSVAPGGELEPYMPGKGCFFGAVALYHFFCAGLVVLAVLNSWISEHGGGSVSWELWALWQQLCLWTLFVQNLLRCCMEDAEALRASTMKVVLLYTVPCISDLFDTMKDWIITGICFLEPRNSWGWALGVLLVTLEVACLWAGRLPQCIQLHSEMSVSLPLVLLQVLYALMTLVLAVGPGFVWLVVTVYANVRFALYSFVVLPFTILLFALHSVVALALLLLQWLACLVGFCGMALVDIPIAVASLFDSGLIWSCLRWERERLQTYCSISWYQPNVWFNQTNITVHSKSLTKTDVDSMLHEQDLHEAEWTHAAYLFLADGGLLCV